MKWNLGLLLVILSLKGFSQSDPSFDKNKWAYDVSDSLTTSYRGTITDNPHFFSMIAGKNKRQIIRLLGKPDNINIKGFSGNKVGYVYCIGRTTINENCRKKSTHCIRCKRSSVTIIFNNSKVVDLIGTNSSG
jgi:outer membrane protein assembly factor BamE (lipoprotein component of BamABCDE complex)